MKIVDKYGNKKHGLDVDRYAEAEILAEAGTNIVPAVLNTKPPFTSVNKPLSKSAILHEQLIQSLITDLGISFAALKDLPSGPPRHAKLLELAGQLEQVMRFEEVVIVGISTEQTEVPEQPQAISETYYSHTMCVVPDVSMKVVLVAGHINHAIIYDGSESSKLVIIKGIIDADNHPKGFKLISQIDLTGILNQVINNILTVSDSSDLHDKLSYGKVQSPDGEYHYTAYLDQEVENPILFSMYNDLVYNLDTITQI